MANWSEEARKLAGIRIKERMANKTPEEISAIRKKAAETRRINAEAKTDPNWLNQQKGLKHAKKTNLDELAQQLGFGSAQDALIEMAVRKAGFASVQDATMWAVKQKTSGQADQVSRAVAKGGTHDGLDIKWDGFDEP